MTLRSILSLAVTAGACGRQPTSPPEPVSSDPCATDDVRACEDAALAAALRGDPNPPLPVADRCHLVVEAALASTAGPVALRATAATCRTAVARAVIPPRVDRRVRPFPRGARWRCPGRCGPPDRTWLEVTPQGDGCFTVEARHGTGGSTSRLCVDNGAVRVADVSVW
jgi:hypothetical protein